MNLDRLRALHAVSVHGSVAGAAQALHVTPSGVSQQLGKLERETGHPLLEPDGRGVRLTRAGHVLAGHAARVLTQLAAAQTELDGLSGSVAGPVRIGAFVTAARAVLPPALTMLRERHPRLAPIFQEGEADHVLPALVRGDLDLGLIESWDTLPVQVPASISLQPLLRDVIDVAIPSRHPLARRRVVDLAEVDDLPWATWTADTTCQEQLIQTLRERNVEPEVACTVADYPTQLAFVAAGLAAALVPRMGRDPLPDGVSVLATRPAVHRKVYAAWRADADRPAIGACLEALDTVAQGIPA
ncbi:LysR family transcriptional regulator [Spirillospora sp. CA-294931]|uniref:LysR family transcriptional regulator n=1 Tax=Spirillospora sp. CA-294931 TaxID=3240042 RepID=UPI003D947074